MDRDTIEKAAKEFLLNEPLELGITSTKVFQTGFIEGANWRINSVWHDATEKPNGMFIIIIDFGNEIGAEEFGLGMTSDDLDGARRWAYVSDLLPEGMRKYGYDPGTDGYGP